MEGEKLFELRRRTFDTPEFRGIEFIEAEAKSIINHVPGNFLSFNWTINPYRGCSHSCTYTELGTTPILMADGRTKLLERVRPGDEIYGTVRVGNYRRYVKTRVLAKWMVIKPAYRTTLEDGTELVTSGHHRFLSNRGWKFVTGSEQGPARRPHLTVNNELMGTGRFARQPRKTRNYRRGYLAGMIRGDAHLSTHWYLRRGGPLVGAPVHRFRLALVDLEGLRRTRAYLEGFAVPTREFLFQEAVGERKSLSAIGASSGPSVATIKELIAWPRFLADDWCKGFLAGIFDAEGSYSRGILRFANTDQTIIDCIVACLENLDFKFVVEDYNRENGLKYVRLVGGLREALRFFHTVDPAITRKRIIDGQAIKNNAPLRVVSIEPLGVDLPMYDITTGTGDYISNGVVSHNCFARVTHTYMDMNAGRDFETKIVVKVNAPELLRRQLASKRWKGEHIAMGTATDPYQRAEGRYELMPGIIRALTDYRNPFSILTKGTLILRDLPLLTDAADVTDVSAALSIGTLDEDAWHRSEPGTPHPRARMDAVAALNEAGIPCGVMVAPILPGITDDKDKLREVVRAAIDAGATHVSPILLHLRPTVREEYMAWLADQYPELVPRYEEMYRTNAYASPRDRKQTTGTVGALVREAGGLRTRPGIAARFHRQAKAEAEQPEDPDPGEQLSLL
jgi:DNA repair photolyase